MTFRYLTPDRMQWHRWTRKRRLKFRKRWRKQHNGMKFRWFISEFFYAYKSLEPWQFQTMVFFLREDSEKLSPFIKA